MNKKVSVFIVLLLVIGVAVSDAVLNHIVVETRPYYTSWKTLYEITDSVTGKVYNRRFNTDHNPSVAEKDAFAVVLKDRIQREIDYQANEMNLTTDESLLLDYYRLIKRDVVLQIRQYPGSTLAQAAAYIASQYPNSPFDFNQLYARWLIISNSADWSAFKLFCIDHKFRGID